MQDGVRAAAKIFINYYKDHGLRTLAEIIARWAPPSDHNPTDSYAKFVSDACGVHPDDQIDVLDPEFLSDLVAAVCEFEDGGQWVDSATIQAAVNEALGETSPHRTGISSP